MNADRNHDSSLAWEIPPSVAVSRIHLRFEDSEEAGRAFSAAEEAVEAHPDPPCRVIAVVTRSSS